jgi:hypothetical protein
LVFSHVNSISPMSERRLPSTSSNVLTPGSRRDAAGVRLSSASRSTR